jgi:hypothetical protein
VGADDGEIGIAMGAWVWKVLPFAAQRYEARCVSREQNGRSEIAATCDLSSTDVRLHEREGGK